MEKMKYEKPTVKKISFSIEDTLMADGGGDIPGVGGDGGSSTIIAPWSLDEGYQLH